MQHKFSSPRAVLDAICMKFYKYKLLIGHAFLEYPTPKICLFNMHFYWMQKLVPFYLPVFMPFCVKYHLYANYVRWIWQMLGWGSIPCGIQLISENCSKLGQCGIGRHCVCFVIGMDFIIGRHCVCLPDQHKLCTENVPNDRDGFHNVPMTKLVCNILPCCL